MIERDLFIDFREELKKSAEIQRAVLPKMDNLSFLEIGVIYRPYRDVSGDLYDCLSGRENEVSFFLGDVTGHGFSAALMTMMVHIFIEHIPPDLRTNECLYRLNKLIVNQNTGLSVSGVFFQISADGMLTVSHAGHPPLIVISDEKENPRHFNEGGCALGIFENPPLEYKEEDHKLSNGDLIAVYSDGLIECRNRENQHYGLTRLSDFLKINCSLKLETLISMLGREVDSHLQTKLPDDDITVLLIRYTGSNC